MPDESTLPEHVGIILDGNRRWAAAAGVSTLEGHRLGSEVFKTIALHAFERGVKYLSAYIFSNENKQRNTKEIGYLMKLVISAVENYLKDFHKQGIKVLVLGSRKGLSQKVLEAVNRAENETKDNTAGTLALCFNYGGRDEIAEAATVLASQSKPITAETISGSLYKPEVPDIDLIIRTSGEQRLSGFMLWRAAYAELYFSPLMWPAFTTKDFDVALTEFANRQRRFGK